MVADATTKLTNPAFFVKMGLIALAVVVQRRIQNRVLGDPQTADGPFSPHARMLAVTSLVCWIGAITAGRLLAYVGEVSGLK